MPIPSVGGEPERSEGLPRSVASAGNKNRNPCATRPGWVEEKQSKNFEILIPPLTFVPVLYTSLIKKG